MTKLFLYYMCTDGTFPDSRTLLLRAASEHTGLPASAFSVHRESGKKPYFTSHPDLHFSVSHSESLWCCLFAGRECGLDVQFQKSGIRHFRLAQRWFHPREAEKICTEQDFYRIWSRKEAFVKALGIGIDPQFKTFDAAADLVSLGETALFVRNLSLPGILNEQYTAAAAYETDFSVEMIPISFDL
ncbi:MAG: 4'-phosphopantetheinyl transferase superfamily protein [Clostridia bacterium]|nr:4'-phosphopantetheinyl transferase superfamily protein [Clostridia bacterium]